MEPPELLDRWVVESRLEETPGWRIEGNMLRYEIILKNFAEALAFVNQVGGIAEQANHHPDIEIRWNRVILNLFTHSRGGITEKDLSLAKQISALA